MYCVQVDVNDKNLQKLKKKLRKKKKYQPARYNEAILTKKDLIEFGVAIVTGAVVGFVACGLSCLVRNPIVRRAVVFAIKEIAKML